MATINFNCKKCDFIATKKITTSRHLFTHIPYEQWPYTCPVPSCRWYGKFTSDYKAHIISKKHITNHMAYPEVDDTQPAKNPKRKTLIENEWIEIETTEPESPIIPSSPQTPTLQHLTQTPPPPISPLSIDSTPLLDEPTYSKKRKTAESDKENVHQSKRLSFIIPKIPHPVKNIHPANKTSSSTNATSTISKSSAMPLAEKNIFNKIIKSSSKPSSNTTEAAEKISTPVNIKSSVSQEIVTTRKDLTHHFQRLIDHVDLRGRDQRDAIEQNNTEIKQMNDRMTTMETYMQANLQMKIGSIQSTRLRISGIIDDFIRTLAPLHNHPHDLPFYLSSCEKCRNTEELLLHTLKVSAPELLNLNHRE